MEKIQFGININAHPLLVGDSSPLVPESQALADSGIQWVRMVFMYADQKFERYDQHYDLNNIERAVDNINATLGDNRNPVADHRAYIEKLQEISPDTRVLMVLNYQTLHSTSNAGWTANDWAFYARAFGRACGLIADGLRGLNVAYEIWNEGDENLGSSVEVSAKNFGPLLVAAYQNIKAADSSAEVVVGGLVGGAGFSSAYFQRVMLTLAVENFIASSPDESFPFDAIGIHPYVKYAGENKPPWVADDDTSWIHIRDEMAIFEQNMPAGVPFWITEWGIAQYTDEWREAVANYMQNFVEFFQNRPNNTAPVLIWFGYADGGGETAGIVTEGGQQKGPVFDRFFAVGRQNAGLPAPTELALTYPSQTAFLAETFRQNAQRLRFGLHPEDANSEVLAGASGQVTFAEAHDDNPNMFEVRIDFESNGVPHQLGYRFLTSMQVAVHDMVNAGQVIGTAGEVDEADGFVMRLERLGEVPLTLDPQNYLTYPYDVDALGMDYVDDITIDDEDPLAPNVREEKVWRVRNSGSIPWIEDSRWVQVDAPASGYENVPRPTINTDGIRIPAVQPGEEFDVVLPFTVPDEPGLHQARFQMETPQGVRFGDMPWMVFNVVPEERENRETRESKLTRRRPDASLFSDLAEFPVLMLDISHHQAEVDFQAAVDFGIRVIFHKATETDDFTDRRYQERKPQAQALGLLWGAYHFGRNTDAATQVDHFLSFAPPDGRTVYALDLELGMPLDVAVEFVRIFEERTGTLPVIYTSAHKYNQASAITAEAISLDDRALLGACPLWVAHYTSRTNPNAPILPTPWRDFQWMMWQFTSNEQHVLEAGAPEFRIPNFTAGAHDVDMYHGTAEQIEAF